MIMMMTTDTYVQKAYHRWRPWLGLHGGCITIIIIIIGKEPSLSDGAVHIGRFASSTILP